MLFTRSHVRFTTRTATVSQTCPLCINFEYKKTIAQIITHHHVCDLFVTPYIRSTSETYGVCVCVWLSLPFRPIILVIVVVQSHLTTLSVSIRCSHMLCATLRFIWIRAECRYFEHTVCTKNTHKREAMEERVKQSHKTVATLKMCWDETSEKERKHNNEEGWRKKRTDK